jgi:predicted RNA-binding Zn-ribbon protein involved in translation (DUF1610 family)
MSPDHTDAVRQYTCLACEDTVTEFQTECPSCGETAFRTAKSNTNEQKSPLQRIADGTARVNPYIPR